jgi:hypothetical protein
VSHVTTTDQGKIGELLEQIYGIKTGFMGQIKSGIASKLPIKMLTEIANDKHLKPWSDLTKVRISFLLLLSLHLSIWGRRV